MVIKKRGGGESLERKKRRMIKRERGKVCLSLGGKGKELLLNDVEKGERGKKGFWQKGTAPGSRKRRETVFFHIGEERTSSRACLKERRIVRFREQRKKKEMYLPL